MSRQVTVAEVLVMPRVVGQVVRPMDARGDFMFVVVDQGDGPSGEKEKGIWIEGLDGGDGSHFDFVPARAPIVIASSHARADFKREPAWVRVAKRYPEIDW